MIRDGQLAAILLSLVFGLALSRQQWRSVAATLVPMAAVASASSALVFPDVLAAPTAITAAVFTAICVFVVYWARALPNVLLVASAIGVGLVIGALTSFGGQASLLVRCVPTTLVVAPAAWLVRTDRAIVVKVGASWIMAVALLALGLTVAVGASAGSDHLA